jgi:hypothetical protein
MSEPGSSLDILGMKPVADAVSTVTTATTAGAGAFLSRICLPAAQEFGFLLEDKVRGWRANNATTIAKKAESKLRELQNHETLQAHPRVVGAVIEHGSWSDEETVQEMWAGLLASACTADGRSQENFIFVSILSQLNPNQARILRFACTKCKKTKSPSGLVTAVSMEVPVQEVVALTGTSNIHTLDLEFDHLRGLGLIDVLSGLNPEEEMAAMCPTAIGLQLHMRSEGFVGSPIEFYSL